MTYSETIEYLFSATPNFQEKGASAYKPGLERVLAMAEYLDSPQYAFPAIHVAGTNGKGSTASALASVLQSQSYKVGLFTSPHLVDFRERIRINGIAVPESFVVNFVENVRPLLEKWSPSFFELTTLMAFHYFAQEEVDIAVVEVGLGGRLDATNILSPILSIITNISLDHTQFLGTSLSEIAYEKAGIIKEGTPVVIGAIHPETKPVFEQQAGEKSAPLYFAEEMELVQSIKDKADGLEVESKDFGSLSFPLAGLAQHSNVATILSSVKILKDVLGWELEKEAVQKGFERLIEQTKLLGRWQQLATKPKTFCDTGHNESGIQLVVEHMQREEYKKLHILFGMVADKDWQKVLTLLPKGASYYFVSPPSERGLPVEDLTTYAHTLGLFGQAFPSIEKAYQEIIESADEQDFIYIGGSNYVVAEILKGQFPHLLEENQNNK